MKKNMKQAVGSCSDEIVGYIGYTYNNRKYIFYRNVQFLGIFGMPFSLIDIIFLSFVGISDQEIQENKYFFKTLQ